MRAVYLRRVGAVRRVVARVGGTSPQARGATDPHPGRARLTDRRSTTMRRLQVARLILTGAAAVALAGAWGCDDETKRSAAAMTGGDPDRGGRLIQVYGCGSCHDIPGIHGADG